MFAFHALGTEVMVALPGVPEALGLALAGEVAAHFAKEEQRFSRFRQDSELSALNASEGPCAVSAPMFEALLAARRAWELTGGVFDATVGGALVAAGYDRSFAPGALDRERPGARAPRASFADVVLEASARTVTRPPRVLFDLAGLVKGRVVDEAARLLPSPAVVEAGGDARFVGNGPDGRGWPVDVEDPRDPSATVLSLVVGEGAVATSAPNRRRWRVGARIAHHLVDPRTGAPAESGLAQVTVVADRVEQADVLAKTAFILGPEAGRAFLERQGDVLGVLVRDDGTVEVVGSREASWR
jgi:thiamine biosynthesis lipoprotein